MGEREIDKINFDLITEDSDIGYMLEVDLEYPSNLHDLHNYYPLAPNKLKVPDDMLSSYCSSIAKHYGIKIGEVHQLIPNLKDKSNYVIH